MGQHAIELKALIGFKLAEIFKSLVKLAAVFISKTDTVDQKRPQRTVAGQFTLNFLVFKQCG